MRKVGVSSLYRPAEIRYALSSNDHGPVDWFPLHCLALWLDVRGLKTLRKILGQIFQASRKPSFEYSSISELN